MKFSKFFAEYFHSYKKLRQWLFWTQYFSKIYFSKIMNTILKLKKYILNIFQERTKKKN